MRQTANAWFDRPTVCSRAFAPGLQFWSRILGVVADLNARDSRA